MVPALCDQKFIFFYFVNKTMLTIDTPGPIAGPIMSKRFRTA